MDEQNFPKLKTETPSVASKGSSALSAQQLLGLILVPMEVDFGAKASPALASETGPFTSAKDTSVSVPSDGSVKRDSTGATVAGRAASATLFAAYLACVRPDIKLPSMKFNPRR